MNHGQRRLSVIRRGLIAITTATLLAMVVVYSGVAGGTSTVLTASLTGKYLHTTSRGAGTATITITSAKVCWRFRYRGLDQPGDSGIHIAPPPAPGVHSHSVFPFTATTSQKGSCVATTAWGAAGPTWVAKIAARPGRFYVIIATRKYPQGAVGGVLTRR